MCFQVNAIFVNIFGGIIRCDEIAKGIIAAAQESNLTTPIVVRLQGNCMNCTNWWYNHVSVFHLEGGALRFLPPTGPVPLYNVEYIHMYITKCTDAKIYVIKLRLGD